MKALILAAGYATRLYPLTKEFPKPLLEVKGRPIIDYIVDKVDSVSVIDEIYLITNSKFIKFFRLWKNSIKSSKKITIIDDLTRDNQDRLGAIGDINFVIKRQRIKEDLLVIGGDNLFSGSLSGFLAFAKNNISAVSIGLYRVKRKEDASCYGVAKLDSQNKVMDFIEKPRNPQSNLVAMCLYYMPKDFLSLIGQYLQNKKKRSDATGSYIAWLKTKADIYGYVFNGSWFDIGDYKYLNAAKEIFVQ